MDTAPDKRMIGRALQDVRKRAGFKSAEAFAAAIGMKTSAYTEYEQGRRSFSYEQAWVMADALQCSIDELGGREWPPGKEGSAPVDERQERMIEDYEALSEPGKDSASNVVHGIRLNEESQKSKTLAIPGDPLRAVG